MSLTIAFTFLFLLSCPLLLVLLLAPAAKSHRQTERVQTRLEALLSEAVEASALERTMSGGLEGRGIDDWVIPILAWNHGIVTKVILSLLLLLVVPPPRLIKPHLPQVQDSIEAIGSILGVFINPETVANSMCWAFLLVLALLAWPLFLLFVPIGLMSCFATVAGCDCDNGHGESIFQCCSFIYIIYFIIYYTTILPTLCPVDETGHSYHAWVCTFTRIAVGIIRVLICIGSKAC